VATDRAIVSSSDYVERLTAGELLRISRVHLMHIEKDRERSCRYYQRNNEKQKATNFERYHRKQAQKRAAEAEEFA
jgi:hypothetical protein